MLNVFRKRFNIISTRVEQVLLTITKLNYSKFRIKKGLYREGKVIFGVTLKTETFPFAVLFM